MKHGKQTRIICLLLLCLLLYGIAFPAGTEEKLELREILTSIGELVPVDQTRYVLAKEWKGSNWGVYNTDGELLIPYRYASISYLSFHCFDVGMYPKPDPKKQRKDAPTLEEINSHAIVLRDGTLVSPYLYGVTKALSPYWALGIILEDGSEEDNDYTLNGLFYRIARCDVFFLGDHAVPGGEGNIPARKVAVLKREQYQNAVAHGQYLSMQDQQGQITVYDSAFQPVDLKVKRLTESIYGIKNWMLVNRITKETVMDGCASVEEAPTQDGLLLKVTRIDYSGYKWTCILTESGEELMPLTMGTAVSVSMDYVLLSSNGKQGLYSIKEQKLLLPCAFDKIVACETSLDPYLIRGKLTVENGKKRYYFHVDSGWMVEAENKATGRAHVGNTYYKNDKRNFRAVLYADDMIQYYLDGNVKPVVRGSGYLLTAKTEYENALVTCYGQIVKRFHTNPFVITDDDHIIIQTTGAGYKLCELITLE